MNVRLIWPMLLPATALVGGCALVGPASISNGRSVYNEVINQTEDQQILNTIVRLRYDRTFGMLTVASVTANIRLRAELNAEVGAGSSSNYVGNLVPLSEDRSADQRVPLLTVPVGG